VQKRRGNAERVYCSRKETFLSFRLASSHSETQRGQFTKSHLTCCQRDGRLAHRAVLDVARCLLCKHLNNAPGAACANPSIPISPVILLPRLPTEISAIIIETLFHARSMTRDSSLSSLRHLHSNALRTCALVSARAN